MFRYCAVTAFDAQSNMLWHTTVFSDGTIHRAFGSDGRFEPITLNAFLELCAFAHYIGYKLIYYVDRGRNAVPLQVHVKISALQAS